MASISNKQTATEESFEYQSSPSSGASDSYYNQNYTGDEAPQYGDEEDVQFNGALHDTNAETIGHEATAQTSEPITPNDLVALAASMEEQAMHDLSVLLTLAFGFALSKSQYDCRLIPGDPEQQAALRLTRAFASVLHSHFGQFSEVVDAELAKLLPGYPPWMSW